MTLERDFSPNAGREVTLEHPLERTNNCPQALSGRFRRFESDLGLDLCRP